MDHADLKGHLACVQYLIFLESQQPKQKSTRVSNEGLTSEERKERSRQRRREHMRRQRLKEQDESKTLQHTVDQLEVINERLALALESVQQEAAELRRLTQGISPMLAAESTL